MAGFKSLSKDGGTFITNLFVSESLLSVPSVSSVVKLFCIGQDYWGCLTRRRTLKLRHGCLGIRIHVILFE
jgi:hypothetical protein